MEIQKYRQRRSDLTGKIKDISRKLKENILKHPDKMNVIIYSLKALIAMLCFFMMLNSSGKMQEVAVNFISARKNPVVPGQKDIGKYVKELKRDINLMERRLSILIPAGNYLFINTAENSFRLYRSGRLRLEGFCSTGSYILLEADNRKWIFNTPQGVFRIQGKIKYPVWRKPDWAFIEEGIPVPPPHVPERYEYGVLGDYALSLGKGYFIHGTLYERLLGMPVTHGCIRMNDKDLETVYYTLQEGSKVFIF